MAPEADMSEGGRKDRKETAGASSVTVHQQDGETSSDKPHLDEQQQKPWPEASSGSGLCERVCDVYSRWSFSYMNPILRKGKRQFQDNCHLDINDLYAVPDEMRSSLLVSRFWEVYKETGGSLLRTLWKIAAPSFIPAGYWEFIYITCRVSLPLSLRQLLLVIQENPAQDVVEQGLPFVITLSLAALIGALAQNRTAFLSTKSGIMTRAAMTSAMYEHALRLTPDGRRGLTSGEVTNLVATDTQKLFDVMLEGHNIWSCPVLIVVVTILLAVIIGPELIVGVGILLAVVPVVKVMVSRMLRIRKRRSELTDVRINVLTTMLQGIRVAKLSHYEAKISEHVSAIRAKEMKLLRSELSMWGWVLTAAVVSPLIALGAAFAFYVLVSESNILTPADAFSALLLFSILRFPINMTARLAGKLAQALDAARRISRFLEREIRVQDVQEPSRSSSRLSGDVVSRPIIDIRDESFVINPQDELLSPETSVEKVQFHNDGSRSAGPVSDLSRRLAKASLEEADTSIPLSFTLRNVSLELRKTQVVAVIGKVGSGKSLLLQALLGELPSITGEFIEVDGSLAYASQLPFVLNTSLRENVLFGSCYNEGRYEKALDACCLRPDIQRLGPAGDLTQIGERGVTLSGGQKQRVALARTVYAAADLALLDDVFSALDAHTAAMVFDGLFGNGCDGVLRTSATVLVTHAVHFLPRVDCIVVISDGEPIFCGSWPELQCSGDSANDLIGTIQNSDQGQDIDKKRKVFRGSLREEGFGEKDGFIMTIEDREYGRASLAVWGLWLKNAGGWVFALVQLVLLVLDRGFYIASDWWIAKWSDAAYEPVEVFGRELPAQTDGRSVQARYVVVYAIIIAFSIAFAALRSQWAMKGGARCAEIMFTAMTDRVLRAPMSYFETTPLGRVLNRFTYDVEVLDIELSVSMAGIMISSSWLISSVVVMIAVLPWTVLGIVPVGILYFFIQIYYRMTGPDLQRIDAISRTPIQAGLAEGLEGASTIRAFRKEGRFTELFRSHVDKNSSAMLNFIAAQRWLGLRIELLGSSITFLVSLIVVCANGSLAIDPGFVGLLIQWSVVFSAALNFFFLRLSESEARITSIERVHKMSLLPQEASWQTNPSVSLDPSWPLNGELEFDHVNMRYRSELPLALEAVSFKLMAGMRCGVVGRTGSGKTSLAAALFRLVEIESGRILLDGIDLAKIGLSDVRGRSNGMRMIPQDPFLFAGTMRDCLDPFHMESDDRILEALVAVNHKDARERGPDVLKDKVEEGGKNYSVGERQLLCLARAIVEEPRVLVLDEATASVDSNTDDFIQEMLRTSFSNTTLFTIAHRLHTVMDYDVILVMEDGHAVEFGSPKDLLDKEDGVFTGLVDATGSDSAANLRKVASSRYKSV